MAIRLNGTLLHGHVEANEERIVDMVRPRDHPR